jgi:predicted enzyme related to lactoylglutathione lyase
MPGTLCHWEILTADVARAEKYYGDLFGWEFKREMGDDYIFAITGKSPAGAIGKAPEGTKIGDNLSIYFQVDDCAGYLNKAVSLGGKEIKGKTEIPGYGWYGVFADPDGNNIGLFEAPKK